VAIRRCLPGGITHLPTCPAIIEASGDGGRTWHVRSRRTYATDLSFVDGRNGWAAATVRHDSSAVLLATMDGGRTWQRMRTPRDCQGDVWVDPVLLSLTDAYVGCWAGPSAGSEEHSVHFTRDAAASWQRFEAPASGYAGDAFFLPDGHGWIGMSAEPGAGGLLATADGGRHWRWLGIPDATVRSIGSIWFGDDLHGLASFAGINCSFGEGVLQTNDGGEHWHVILSWPHTC
jgi:photosystem II stability/assembly factor-like uncharacterized protein